MAADLNPEPKVAKPAPSPAEPAAVAPSQNVAQAAATEAPTAPAPVGPAPAAPAESHAPAQPEPAPAHTSSAATGDGGSDDSNQSIEDQLRQAAQDAAQKAADEEVSRIEHDSAHAEATGHVTLGAGSVDESASAGAGLWGVGSLSGEEHVSAGPEGVAAGAGVHLGGSTMGVEGATVNVEGHGAVDWSDGVDVSGEAHVSSTDYFLGVPVGEVAAGAEGDIHVDSRGAGASAEVTGTLPTMVPATTMTGTAEGHADVSWSDGVAGSAGGQIGATENILGTPIAGVGGQGEVSGGVTFRDGVQVTGEASAGESAMLLGVTETASAGAGGSAGIDTGGVSESAFGREGISGDAFGAGAEVHEQGSVTWASGLQAGGDVGGSVTGSILGADQTVGADVSGQVGIDTSGASVEGGVSSSTHGNIGSGQAQAEGGASIGWGHGPSAEVHAGESTSADVWGVQAGESLAGSASLSGAGAEVGGSASVTGGIGGQDVTVDVRGDTGIGGGEVHASAGGGIEGVAEGDVGVSVGTGGAKVEASGELAGQNFDVSAGTDGLEHAAGQVGDAVDDAGNAASDAAGDVGDAASDAAGDAEDTVSGWF